MVKFVINKVKIVLMNRLHRKLCALFAAVLVLLPAVSCKKESNEVQSILFTNIASNKLTLTEGSDFRVKYVVEPYHLQESAVLEWTTSKKDVASVRNGRITALQPGRTQITATCGNATAFINVEVVKLDVTSFRIPTSISGYVGAPVKVDVTDISPEEATVSNIDWEMTDESVAECYVEDGDLYVKGLKTGTTILTGNGLDITLGCQVVIKAYVPVESVRVTLGENQIMAGGSVKAEVEVLPDNASVKDVEWSVSPSSNASFDHETMTLKTGIASGVVTLTATAVRDQVSGSATLTLTDYVGMAYPEDAPYGHISPDGSVGGYPESIKMIACFSSANKGAVVWKSHDTSRATVDQNGVVTAVGHGSVRISATAGSETIGAVVRSFKLSDVKWTTYNCWTLNPYGPANKFAPISSLGVPGPSGFCVIDPAAWYIQDAADPSDKRLDNRFYYYVNGKFQKPEVVEVPDDFKLDEVAGGPDSTDKVPWGIKFRPLKASNGEFTVDMGIGDKVSLEVSAGVGSISVVYNFVMDYEEILTIPLGGSKSFDKSDYRESGGGLIYYMTIAVNYGTSYDVTWNSSSRTGYAICPSNIGGGIYDSSKKYYKTNSPRLWEADSGTYKITMETPLGEFDPGKELSFTLNIVD